MFCRGNLVINAINASPFTIDITSASLNGWDPGQDYTWIIATFEDGITGFDASAFTLDTTNFSEALSGAYGTGAFGIRLANSDQDLELYYTAAVPEPSTLALTALALVGVLGVRHRRRNSAR